MNETTAAGESIFTRKPQLPALDQVRTSTRALLDQGKSDEAWQLVFSALEAVLVKTKDLELLVAKLRAVYRGTRSEKSDPAQLRLFLEELARQGQAPPEADPVAEAKEDAELDQEIENAEKEREAGENEGKERKKGPGWGSRGVEKRIIEVRVPEAERICAKCSKMKRTIGEDVTRRLEWVPGHFVENETHMEKVVCCDCKDGVTTAEAPPQVLDRSAAGASLLADVVIEKHADHTPLHRLVRKYARNGVDIAVSTLSDWINGVGRLVDPLVDRLAQRVLEAYIIGADATGLRVLDPMHPAGIQRGSIWAYVGDERDVLFRYTPTGEGQGGPWSFLAGRTGLVQADASSVFDRVFNGKVASAVEAGCWSHARRRLVALEETDLRVAYPLKLVAKLYRIEHLADARGLDPEKRLELRKERSAPTIKKLKRWYVTTIETDTPASAIVEAASYALNHWAALTRFLEDGRLKLDNNTVEQQLRDIAVGRKNYLFAGSHDAARNAANLYSLTRTCIRHGVPLRPYFTDVLQKLGAGWDPDRLDELLPHAWKPPDGGSPAAPRGTAQGP
jgi:transposase